LLFIVLFSSVGCSSKSAVKVVTQKDCSTLEKGHGYSLEFLEQRYDCTKYEGAVK